MRGRFNNTQLKYLAASFMFLDHFALILLDGSGWTYLVFRGIGRLAAPIFFWTIAEGAWHTKHPKRYLTQLLGFGVIFQLAYWWSLGGGLGFQDYLTSEKNIFLTLALGLIALLIMKGYPGKPLVLGTTIVVFPLIATLFQLDYGWYGVGMMILFYWFRKDNSRMTLWIILLSGMRFLTSMGTMGLVWNSTQWLALLALPLIFLHNGERGKGNRYFFYLFYPTHLLLLQCLQSFL